MQIFSLYLNQFYPHFHLIKLKNHYNLVLRKYINVLKIFAAALIREIPPISIFSIISLSLWPELTVFQMDKGQQSLNQY